LGQQGLPSGGSAPPTGADQPVELYSVPISGFAKEQQ
jgi:hypothetical protein